MNENANVPMSEIENTVNPAVEAQRAVDRETADRAIVLHTQATTIKAITGIDVLAEYERNEIVRSRILNGEIDFVGLYREMENNPTRVPSVIRNANHAQTQTGINIHGMSPDQFKKLDAMLEKGSVISL